MKHFNPFSLEGKRILVVGASSGIGKEIAIETSRMGADIIICSRSKDKLSDLREELSDFSCDVFPVDITMQNDVNALVDSIPSVDGVVVSSGKSCTSLIQFASHEKLEDIFDLNFYAPFELIRLLYKKNKIRKKGSIVLIASVAGNSRFLVGNCIYGSSKAALNAFMRYAAIEFAAKDIRVNSINPGMVNTNLANASGVFSDENFKQDMKQYPLKRYGEVQDIAPAAIYLLSDASSWVTGHALVIDGGVSLR